MLRRVADFLRRGSAPTPAAGQAPSRAGAAGQPAGSRSRHERGSPPPATAAGAAGRARDYDGPVQIAYEPVVDGRPDPGEVVWTWVPFEEDPSWGKDRPVLVLGHAVGLPGAELAVLMLTSTVHAGDPRWMLLGAGGWDVGGRVSSVRVDRVLAVSPQAIRREGSALDRVRFERVAGAVRQARPAR